MVNEPQKPHEGHNRLDNTENAGCEEAGVGTGDANALEDRGAVVIDGVDAVEDYVRDSITCWCIWRIARLPRAVLPQEKHATKEEAPLDLALLERSERLPETGANFLAVALEVGINVLNLFNDVLVFRG